MEPPIADKADASTDGLEESIILSAGEAGLWGEVGDWRDLGVVRSLSTILPLGKCKLQTSRQNWQQIIVDFQFSVNS